MKLKFILTIALIATFTSSFSQETSTQTIRGKVYDEVTHYPLIGALVTVLSNQNLSTLTNEDGEFRIDNVPLGRQSIEISYMGYKTQIVDNLLIISGKEAFALISLEEDAVTIESVVVEAKAPTETALNEMANVSARAITVEQTERFAGSLGDPARMAANYAGVSSKDDSRNDIVIRGNSPSGVLWRLEGIEIPNPNHFGSLGSTGGPVSMLNNNILATSDFMTGAFPAEYGNALAGAFDLNMRSGNSHEHEFVGQVGFNGFEFGAEGPFSKKEHNNASYLINYRYSTLGVMDALGIDMGTGTAIPQYQDLTYMFDFPTKNAGRFKVFGLYGKSFISLGRDLQDTAENLYISKGTATDFGSHLTVYGASHTYYFNPRTRLKTTISYQETGANTIFDSVRTDYTIMPFARQHMNENKASITQQVKYKYSSKINLSMGYIYDVFMIDYVDSVYIHAYDSFKKGSDTHGNLQLIQAYVQTQYKPTNNITTYVGLHSQHFTLNSQTVLEPRLSVDYKISENQNITIGYGIHNQTQPKMVYFHQKFDSITNTYEQSNTNLKFTTNNHYILGYNWKFAKHARIKAEFYYQELENVPISPSFKEYSMINSGADFAIQNVQNLENTGTGTNKGVEITLERFLNNGFYILSTASFFDSKYVAYDKIERNSAFNGNFTANFLGGYEYIINEKFMLTFDVKTTYAGGKRYVPIDIAESIKANEAVYDWTHAYEKKYDPYFRTDLRIGFKHNAKKYSQEYGIDLQNITNYQSIFMEGYDATKKELYQVNQQGRMPMFLYRIQF